MPLAILLVFGLWHQAAPQPPGGAYLPIPNPPVDWNGNGDRAVAAALPKPPGMARWAAGVAVAGFTATCVWAAVRARTEADRNYRRYRKATTGKRAEELRQNTRELDDEAGLWAALGAVGVGFSLVLLTF